MACPFQRTQRQRGQLRRCCGIFIVSVICCSSLPELARSQENAPNLTSKKSLSGKSRISVVATRLAATSPLPTGYAALLTKDYPAAEQAYRLALQRNAEEIDAWLGLASVAHHQGNLETAQQNYQRVLRHDPQNVTARAGLISLQLTTAPEAATNLAHALAESFPQSATAQALLAAALTRTERLAEAEQSYFAAVQLDPDNRLHTYNLAVALDRLHRPAQAVQYYQRALALAEMNSLSMRHDHLADNARLRLAQLQSVLQQQSSSQPY